MSVNGLLGSSSYIHVIQQSVSEGILAILRGYLNPGSMDGYMTPKVTTTRSGTKTIASPIHIHVHTTFLLMIRWR